MLTCVHLNISDKVKDHNNAIPKTTVINLSIYIITYLSSNFCSNSESVAAISALPCCHETRFLYFSSTSLAGSSGRRLLKAISRHRATLASSENVSTEGLCEKVPQSLASSFSQKSFNLTMSRVGGNNSCRLYLASAALCLATVPM